MKWLRVVGLLLIILACTWLPSIYAQPTADDIANEVTNNISHEYATCYVYSSIVAEAARRSNDNKLEEAYKNMSDKALEYALVAAGAGRSQEMAQKVTTARIELGISEMRGDIDNNISNISILLAKHGDRCKYIMENPEATMDEWSNKVLAKYGIPSK